MGVHCCCLYINYIVYKYLNTLVNQSLRVCEVSYTYLLVCLRYREKHVKDVCCCLQIYNSVVYVVVMGLVLGKSLMVISTMGILL